MDIKDKTLRLLDLMSKRSTIAPGGRSFDQRFAGVEPLPWQTTFSTFNPKHIQEASKIINILLAAYNFDDFLYLANEVRRFENDSLFLYVLYSSVLNRDDCQGVILPPIEECSPHWFFAAETIHEAIQLSIHRPNEDHIVINQKTAEVTEPESRLSYFREDVGMNIHHWSWHVVFPTEWDPNVMGRAKDRQGELFYYMHQQMVARYDCERLSNGFNRVVPLLNFRERMMGYSPHMTSQITGVHFGSRPEGLAMRDLPTVSVQDLETWRLRILEAIDKKFVLDVSGNQISLDNDSGIVILGALVEATAASINPDIYGDLHDQGHNIIAQVHNPDGRFREQPGVMAFIQTAPRDPIFYRWHKFLDEVFARHKSMLRPYTRQELSLEGIRMVRADVMSKERNVLLTFMRQDLSDLSHAPFLRTNRKILVQYEHIDHEPFTFTYQIDNQTGAEKDVTIRVFLSPKYDEGGNLFEINEKRRLMIEIDKIHKRLSPGLNIITRTGSDSSVTVPRYMRSYRLLSEDNIDSEVDYCTCGWPEHMLIPRGKPTGMDFNLFVMCTDYNDDNPNFQSRRMVCSDAISYCGSKDQLYPDRKPMGFPFDRPIPARNMSDFLTPNMLLTDLRIVFIESVQPVMEWTMKMYGTV